MARKSKIVKNEQRKKIIKKYMKLRLELKKISLNKTVSYEKRRLAFLKIQKLPRDASPVRLRNRDCIDGRPRGNFRKFGISRIRFRSMAHKGELPGITKSSW